jgi:predicted O-methyltransferase YrrM
MPRRYSHLSARYIKNRLVVMYYEHKHPTHPWLTADAVAILDQLLKPEDRGVEFGSGRSTAWFAKRLRHLTSVESDEGWYARTQKSLKDQGLTSKVDYRKCAAEEAYAAQATMFEDYSIDFCLIDGVVRDHCALGMVDKIKSGGLLVVDNVNWYLPNDTTHSPDSRRSADGSASDLWGAFASKVASWRRIWTTNGVTDTCIWLKP